MVQGSYNTALVDLDKLDLTEIDPRMVETKPIILYMGHVVHLRFMVRKMVAALDPRLRNFLE